MSRNKHVIKQLFTWAMVFWCVVVGAQSPDYFNLAFRYLAENKSEWQLTDDDISNLTVSDQYLSNTSGATMLYLVQRHKGIKIWNAIYNVVINEDGKIAHAASRLVSDVKEKINTSKPQLTAVEALQVVLSYLDIKTSNLTMRQRVNGLEFIFEKGDFASHDVPVSLQFFPIHSDKISLVWEVKIYEQDGDEAWNIKVDALTGKILKKYSLILRCATGNHPHAETCHFSEQPPLPKSSSQADNYFKYNYTVQSPSYNVYATQDADGNIFPYESPNHGSRNLLSYVEDWNASPYGWHDTNGIFGADESITKGNNAHAFLDISGYGTSQGDEPDGGTQLVFDYPVNLNQNPEYYSDAAVTNAFFMVNYLHDFAYAYGFDEAAGNFQVNNYGNGGQEDDAVTVKVHSSNGLNNADFNITADGTKGVMRIFLWNAVGLLTVDAPADVAGNYEVGTPANGSWGTPITSSPVSAKVVLADDGTSIPFKACEPLVNAAEMNGKIALVDRGGCDFSWKAWNAQNAGAVGAIICNFEDNVITMLEGAGAADVNIPVVSMSSSDCAEIRGFIGNGLEVSLVIPNSAGPDYVSGALDNGVIAHEYGHGISVRLVGGPSNPECLLNGEQMGEGISDFFTLVTTVKPNDTGDLEKTIGTYVSLEPTDGKGIRRFPYTTDMNVNPLTYENIVGQLDHNRGEVFTAMLWDMYWNFVVEYGFDNNLTYGTGGNNQAVQLVMEAMKIVPCSPGFVDFRDAILHADTLLYNGDNGCLIWKSFARRGLGINAQQRDPNNTNDGEADFDLPISCLDEMQLDKAVTEIVLPGDFIDVALHVKNYKKTAVSNVIVTDEIPDGASFVTGTCSHAATIDGGMISFELGTMNPLDVIEINYQLLANPNIQSTTIYKDRVENGDQDWDIEVVEGTNIWTIESNTWSNSGASAWFVAADATASEQILYLKNPVTVVGDQPVLRFYHYYDTEYGLDGGTVEISKDGGFVWEQVNDKIFRNGYPRPLDYFTFVEPFLYAFSGKSNENGGTQFKPTYIDLMDYAGEDIQFRFRFGTSQEVGGLGWYIDDIELLDMKNYEGQACITTDEGDSVCAVGIARGTIVGDELFTTAAEELENPLQIRVYPNPTDAILNIQVGNNRPSDPRVSLCTMNGKVLLQERLETIDGLTTFRLDVSDIPAGIYFVKVRTSAGIVVDKISIY
ncbi:MAG: M36 family metallopeptidase [Bacteroidota bacterium]